MEERKKTPWTDAEKKQIALEYKYHPRRKQEILKEVALEFEEDNDLIWTSVYDVVITFHNQTEFDVEYKESWAKDTTVKFLSKIMDLDGKNTPIQSIVYANHSENYDKVQDALLSIVITEAIARKSPVIDIRTGTSLTGEDSATVYPKLGLHHSVRKQIDELYSGLPMLCKPKPWTNNYNGGYLTDRCQTNIILGGRLKEHSKPINYSAINYLQEIGYRVNTEFIDCTEDEKEVQWVDMPGGKKVKTGYVKNREITKFYADSNMPFYFVVRADNRTRTYPVGYNLNPQGYDYQKASLLFDQKEELSHHGRKWAKIAIAGLYGLDKETFETRYEWFIDIIKPIIMTYAGVTVKSDLTSSVINDLRFTKLIEEAEEPHLFKATVMNYINAI